MEAKKIESQETTTDSNQYVAEFQETNADLEMEQEIVMLMNDLSTPPPNLAISYHQNEDEMPHYPSQVESTSRIQVKWTLELRLTFACKFLT